jgi:hypothetical protein
MDLECQRHLDLCRASDGLVRDAQGAQRRADVQRLTGSMCRCRQARAHQRDRGRGSGGRSHRRERLRQGLHQR